MVGALFPGYRAEEQKREKRCEDEDEDIVLTIQSSWHNGQNFVEEGRDILSVRSE